MTVFLSSQNLMKKFRKTYIVSTDLIDRSLENRPSVHKICFLEGKDNFWDNHNTYSIKRELSRIKSGSIGTIICSPRSDGGYCKMFSFNPEDYQIQLPIKVRRIRLNKSKEPTVIELANASKINLDEKMIVQFDQSLLREGGTFYFKNDWCPQTRFISRKTFDVY